MNRETVRQIITEDLGMKENFCKDGASNLDRWPETTSDSNFIWFLHNADMFDKVLALSKIKKMPWRGEGFADIPDIQRNVTKLMQGIPKNDFQDSFL
jgi:hypothetical protein